MRILTNRELLELAAKAAGLNISGLDEAFPAGGILIVDSDGNDFDWNPLEDDGDCARLESACYLYVEFHNIWVVVSSGLSSSSIREAYADHNGDRNAARRLASVRAAAEIGKTMP